VWVRGTPFGRLVVPLVCRSSAKSSPPGFPGMLRDNCGTPFRPTAPDDSTYDGHIGKLSPAAASDNRGIAASNDDCTRLYIFKEKPQLIGFVRGVQRHRYQPGPSERQKTTRNSRPLGIDHRDAVAGTESGASQLLGQSLNLFGQSSCRRVRQAVTLLLRLVLQSWDLQATA
jgi:hypothetical protein